MWAACSIRLVLQVTTSTSPDLYPSAADCLLRVLLRTSMAPCAPAGNGVVQGRAPAGAAVRQPGLPAPAAVHRRPRRAGRHAAAAAAVGCADGALARDAVSLRQHLQRVHLVSHPQVSGALKPLKALSHTGQTIARQQQLRLSDAQMAPVRKTLLGYGNASSASTRYTCFSAHPCVIT